ncbi:hypothetical protein AO380_1720 [Moraxella catarrhalis]|nr:hypothetical protein AO380_1720 [Moraxella catarrhalis]
MLNSITAAAANTKDNDSCLTIGFWLKFISHSVFHNLTPKNCFQ